MDKILLSPPIVFIIMVSAILLLNFLFSRLSFRSKGHAAGRGKSYACGEDNYNEAAQPDYSNFFAFAFFFAIAHVAALILTTVQAEGALAFILAGLYIITAVIGLYILMRE